MLGRTERLQMFAGQTDGLCMSRPGAAGTIKALVTVSAFNSGPPHPPARTYTLIAECRLGFADGFATRATTVARKQNQ